MKAKKLGYIRKTLLLVCSATVMTLASQGLLAKDFAKVQYFSDGVVWETFLPNDATGVEVSVTFTPTKLEEDSYLDQRTYDRGEKIDYPFFSKLEDGTYRWEMRLLKEGPVRKGFSSKAGEGAIDANGREIAIVGEPILIKGRTYLPNRGRDSLQTGNFVVFRGEIPDVEQPEEGK